MKTETDILIEIANLEKQISEIVKRGYSTELSNALPVLQAKINILNWVIK